MIDDLKLQELAQFTVEGKLSPGYGDGYLFYVGRDDVHGILLHLIKNETLGFKLNMFGYDDDELNQAILDLFKIPSIHVQISLDKSQAGGVHERKIIETDQQQDPSDFANSFTILNSATHQISHTKGGICAAQGLYFEGSTNWSGGGEGTGISLKSDVANPKGFKAQNNTLFVSTNKTNLIRFNTELDVEHLVGKNNK